MESLSPESERPAIVECRGPQVPSMPSAVGSLTANGTLRGRWHVARSGLLRIAIFLLLFGFSAFCLDQFIKMGIRCINTSEIGAFNRAMSGKVNAQVLISGSSRALVQYNPAIIQRVTGRSAYNIGRNGSHIDMQLAVLKAYLAKNRKPEVLIFNLDLHSFQPTKELYDPAQYLPFLGDPHICAGLKNLDPGIWKWKYVPLYGYAVQDMRFSWLNGIKGMVGLFPAEDHILGFNPRDLKWTGDFEKFKADHREGFKVSMDPEGIKYLEDLIQLCAQRNIRLIFVYSPEYLEAQEMTLNRAAIFAQFEALSKPNAIPFLDYSDSPICRERELFYNSQHLNRQGAEAFSRDLAVQLKNLLTN